MFKMYLTLLALLFLINISLTLALTTPNLPSAAPNGTITPPSRYYLKTRVLDGGSPDKNDLYVNSYHTGPLIPPHDPLSPFCMPHSLH